MILQTESKSLLKLDSVSKKMAGNWILKNISLEIASGELLLLRGSNGSGKTSLLRLISGLYLPDRGSIHFSDTKLNPRSSRGRVSLCDNRAFLYSGLTVAENLQLFASLSGAKESDLKKLIDCFQLNAWLSVLLRNCSSGIRKKTSLVRAMLGPLDLLLLDEPYTFLDHSSRDSLSREVDSLHKRGVALFIASNEPNLPSTSSFREVCIKGGELL